MPGNLTVIKVQEVTGHNQGIHTMCCVSTDVVQTKHRVDTIGAVWTTNQQSSSFTARLRVPTLTDNKEGWKSLNQTTTTRDGAHKVICNNLVYSERVHMWRAAKSHSWSCSARFYAGVRPTWYCSGAVCPGQCCGLRWWLSCPCSWSAPWQRCSSGYSALGDRALTQMSVFHRRHNGTAWGNSRGPGEMKYIQTLFNYCISPHVHMN